METIVLDNVPIPDRSGGRRTYGLSAKLASLKVGQTLFIPGGSSRKSSATVVRVGRASGAKFTSRKVSAILMPDGAHQIVEGSPEGSVPGLGIWRTE